MIRLESKEDVTPVCPHCSGQLDAVWMRERRGFLGRRYLYFCCHCHKVLGVTHRKGFLMG